MSIVEDCCIKDVAGGLHAQELTASEEILVAIKEEDAS